MITRMAYYRFPSRAGHRCRMAGTVDLACYQLVSLYGMADMMANHISARVPGEEGSFLINAYGLMYEEITASSLLKVDHHGNILTSPDHGVPAT